MASWTELETVYSLQDVYDLDDYMTAMATLQADAAQDAQDDARRRAEARGHGA